MRQNKITIIIFAISIAGILTLVVPRWVYSSKLQALAEDTCAELEGSMVMQAGPILHKAVSRAERLGYTGFDMGSRMRKHCPYIMDGLTEIDRKNRERKEADDARK